MNKFIFFSIIIILIIIFFIFFDIKIVKSNSMSETLKNNDIILVSKIFKLKRNSIYCFNVKNNFYIKRLIGINNDIIEIKNSILYLNFTKINRINENSYFENYGPIKIREDKCFFIGDNIRNSYDSRFINEVDVISIKYKLIMIIYPVNRWRVFN